MSSPAASTAASDRSASAAPLPPLPHGRACRPAYRSWQRGAPGFRPGRLVRRPVLLLLVALAAWVGARRHGLSPGWLLWPLGLLALGRLACAWRWYRRRGGKGAAVREAQQAPAEDPRIDRMDRLADALRAELAALPEPLRVLGQDPVKTADALRTAAHALVRREAALRARVDPADDARLAREREALEARVRSEPDAVVRERLAAALAALDAQVRQRAEVRLAAERLAAEHTRLLYTLEGLRAQLLRLGAADAASPDVAGAGLDGVLRKLAEELDAVASSVEAVAREEGSHPR